jgi:hypothetical protein
VYEGRGGSSERVTLAIVLDHARKKLFDWKSSARIGGVIGVARVREARISVQESSTTPGTGCNLCSDSRMNRRTKAKRIRVKENLEVNEREYTGWRDSSHAGNQNAEKIRSRRRWRSTNSKVTMREICHPANGPALNSSVFLGVVSIRLDRINHVEDSLPPEVQPKILTGIDTPQ